MDKAPRSARAAPVGKTAVRTRQAITAARMASSSELLDVEMAEGEGKLRELRRRDCRDLLGSRCARAGIVVRSDVGIGSSSGARDCPGISGPAVFVEEEIEAARGTGAGGTPPDRHVRRALAVP